MSRGATNPRTTLADSAREVDRLLSEIRQVLRKPVETEIARGGLTGPQRNVMSALVRTGAETGLTVKEICARVGLAHSTVSGIVDRLQRRGLVERRVDGADRRFSRIIPSRVVQNYMRNRWPGLSLNPLVTALGGATPHDRRTILRGLRTLRRLVKE